MSTATAIRVCRRCGVRYDWRRSPSSHLKMTYCGSLCERGDLGFTLEGLLGGLAGPSPTAERSPLVIS